MMWKHGVGGTSTTLGARFGLSPRPITYNGVTLGKPHRDLSASQFPSPCYKNNVCLTLTSRLGMRLRLCCSLKTPGKEMRLCQCSCSQGLNWDRSPTLSLQDMHIDRIVGVQEWSWNRKFTRNWNVGCKLINSNKPTYMVPNSICD